jgi:malic enzyme
MSSTANILSQAAIRFQDTTGGEYVALRAPGTVSASYTLSLPSADGTNGQAIITNGSGTLSFGNAGITAGKSIALTLVFG